MMKESKANNYSNSALLPDLFCNQAVTCTVALKRQTQHLERTKIYIYIFFNLKSIMHKKVPKQNNIHLFLQNKCVHKI